MLPNQEAGKKLETLLEKLFDVSDGSTQDDIVVLRESSQAGTLFACCSYSYTSYGA